LGAFKDHRPLHSPKVSRVFNVIRRSRLTDRGKTRPRGVRLRRGCFTAMRVISRHRFGLLPSGRKRRSFRG
jgi:hypothetical protein